MFGDPNTLPPTMGSLDNGIVSQLPPIQAPQPTQQPQENFLGRDAVKSKIEQGVAGGIKPQDMLDRMVERGFVLEGLNDGTNESYDKQQQAIAQQPIKELSQSPLKGIPVNQGQPKEWNDNLLPRMQPFFKHTEKDGAVPNAGKLIGNAIPSTYNVAADVGNMILNPYDTGKGLLQTMHGAGVNLVKWGLSKFDEDAPEQVEKTIESLKSDKGVMGRLARTISSNEQVADQVAGAISERYGSSENFAKTMTEDPVGVISDIALLFEGGGALVAKGANVASKGAKLAGFAEEAGTIARIGEKATDVSKFANKNDPYNVAFDQGIKGVVKGANKAVDLAVGTKNAVSNTIYRGLEWIEKEKTGLTADEVKGIQSNPLQKEYRERARVDVSETGVLPSKQEIIRPYVEEMGEKIVSLVSEARDKLSDSGPLYNEIRELESKIDLNSVHSDLRGLLEKNNIKIGDDGKLDFTNSKFIQGRDINAVTSVFDRIMGQSSLDVNGILNLRRAIDSARKWDGAPVDSSGLLTEMRRVVDKEAKAKIPQLKEVDGAYSKQIKELNSIEEGITYRQGNRKGKIRDNLFSIVKNLGGDNRARMRERLSQFIPDLEQRIDAINNLPKLMQAYKDTPKGSKIVTSSGGAIVGGATFGVLGVLGGAILGLFMDNIFQGIRRESIDKIFKELSPEAIEKLKEINDKIEKNQNLAKEENVLLSEIKTKIQAEKTKQTEANKPLGLPAPEATPITPEGVVQGKANTPNPIPKIRDIVETGQENVKQPINRSREEAQRQVQIKEQERIAKKKEVEATKKQQKETYDNAGEAVTDKNAMKAGMPVKVTAGDGTVKYGVIEKVAFDGRLQKVYLEGSPRTGYATAIAKKVDDFDSLLENFESDKPVSKQREETQRIVDNITNQKGTRNYEVQTVLELLGIEDTKNLTDQQIDDIRKVALGRNKGKDYREAVDRLSENGNKDNPLEAFKKIGK